MTPPIYLTWTLIFDRRYRALFYNWRNRRRRWSGFTL